MWICRDCGAEFERFRVKHDYTRRPDGDYDDEYVCPNCGSEDFIAKREEKEEGAAS